MPRAAAGSDRVTNKNGFRGAFPPPTPQHCEVAWAVGWGGDLAAARCARQGPMQQPPLATPTQTWAVDIPPLKTRKKPGTPRAAGSLALASLNFWAIVVSFRGSPYAEAGGIQSTIVWCIAYRPVMKVAREGEHTSCEHVAATTK